MKRSAPPLQAIEAFIVAAHAKTFRQAADQLALSASAFSRRMQSLETTLGVPLFVRNCKFTELTEFGRQYLAAIEPAMNTIMAASVSLRPARRRGVLRVMTSQSFATSWLMRRLANFSVRGVRVQLSIGRDLSRLRSGEVDLAIIGGADDWSHLVSDRLIDLQGVMASAPRLADGRTPPRDLQELENFQLLGVDIPPDLWHRWLTSAGFVQSRSPQPQRFETLSLMYEAAASGLGITIAAPIIAEPHLSERRLLPCLSICAPMMAHYDLLYADHAVRRRADVEAFREWLYLEIERSKREFEQWLDEGLRRLHTGPSVLNPKAAERSTSARRIRQIDDHTHIHVQPLPLDLHE